MADLNELKRDLASWNILVGKIIGHWDRANLKIAPLSEVPDRFAQGKVLCATVGQTRRLLEIRSSRKSGHSFIVDVGLTNTTEAEAFKGAELWIHPSMRPELPPDEFYFDQLIGLRVQTENGEDLGEIEEILESKAHSIYVTPHAMIPGVPEFIVSTDWENKVLVVRDIPGLRTDD
jgi:16S rRNA processing protein RimM